MHGLILVVIISCVKYKPIIIFCIKEHLAHQWDLQCYLLSTSEVCSVLEILPSGLWTLENQRPHYLKKITEFYACHLASLLFLVRRFHCNKDFAIYLLGNYPSRDLQGEPVGQGVRNLCWMQKKIPGQAVRQLAVLRSWDVNYKCCA